MGADVIGWRDCPLQKPLGTAGFLGKLKMTAYLRAIEAQVPADERAGVQVTVVVNDRQRSLSYEDIREQAETFQAGIPDCATCPLAAGRQLGCYHFVTYPVDATFEETAFEMFASQLATKDSISDQIYRDITSRVPAQGTAWHTNRGPNGRFARRAAPLVHTWGGLLSKKRVDSAQLLASLFIPLEVPALVVGYARFWRELVAFADGKLRAEMTRRGIGVDASGQVTLQVSEAQVGGLADKLGADVAALEAYERGTLGEIRKLAAMMSVVAPRSVDSGWRVIVDG
jgi:hypothetical protein